MYVWSSLLIVVLGRNKGRIEDSYVRLMRESEAVDKTAHESAALGYLAEIVQSVLVGHTSFKRLRLHANKLCYDVLSRVRIKIQKDFNLFLEIGIQDNHEICMSNQRTESGKKRMYGNF